MRRHQLSKLGFNTGSPFAPTQRSYMPASLLQAATGARSPAAANTAASPSRNASAAARARTSNSGAVRPGASGTLDAGRLAAARLAYERVATQAAPSRDPNTHKRRREDNTESKQEDVAQAAPAAPAAAAAVTPSADAAPVDSNKRVKREDAVASSSADSAASATSSTFVLNTALSSIVPQPAASAMPTDVRGKSRYMLSECLAAAVAASSADATVQPAADSTTVDASSPDAVAAQIEAHLLSVCGGVADSSYRQKLRDLLFNLRSEGNVPLCLRILSGELTAAQVVQLDFKALAAPAVAADREKLRQENIDDAVYKPPPRLDTTEYKCPNCGSEHCSTMVIREERDISKADTWGSKQGAGSVIDVRCEDCKHSWTKEE